MRAAKSTIQEWEGLLAGVRQTAPFPTEIETLHEALARAIQEALDAVRQRDALEAATAEARRRVKHALERGHEAAMRARSYLRFHFGHRNEELSAFGITPAGRHKA